MSTSFGQNRPLLVHALPTLPFPCGIHRSADKPATFDLPVIPIVVQKVFDALAGSTCCPMPGVVGRRPRHSQPSQREGRGLGSVVLSDNLRARCLCREQTLCFDHAATGCPQPMATHRRTLSMQEAQYPVTLSLLMGPLHARQTT